MTQTSKWGNFVCLSSKTANKLGLVLDGEVFRRLFLSFQTSKMVQFSLPCRLVF